jgi:LCP family protein required for cell wall assembly
MNPNSRPGRMHKAVKVLAVFFAGLSLLGLVCLGGYLALRSYAPAAPPEETPTASATPFQPVEETPSITGTRSVTRTLTPTISTPLRLYTPTPSGVTPPWAPFAGPIHPSPTEIPPPAEELPQGEQSLTIALLGIDKSETAPPYRTDAILILTLDREKQSAALVSFPRDLFVYIPAYGMQRINIAFGQGGEIHYPGGGFALFRDTMKYNFGLRVDNYAMMNFQGFKEMVDRLGGIDVEAAKGLTDFRYGYGTWKIPAGINHMDGSLALWYVRARQTTSDFDRGRRQQEVILAVAQRLMDMRAIPNLPGFFRTFMQYFESDVALDDITPFAEMAGTASLASLRRFRITQPNACTNWTTPQGSMVLLPNYEAIHYMLVEAFNPSDAA